MTAFTTHRDADIDIQSTFRVGTISATRNQLIKAFGEPISYTAEESDRTTSEWHFGFADYDETVAAVYDYKHGSVPGPDEVLSWSIGGKDRKAAELVHEAFRKTLGLTDASTTQIIPHAALQRAQRAK